VTIDSSDLLTETLSNSQGWTIVRVTHRPTGLVAERERTSDRDSPVRAHQECIDELERRLASGAPAPAAPSAPAEEVTRAEFDELKARVERLEARLHG